MKTIRQLADEIGVSKQAVQKRIAREPLCTQIFKYIVIQSGTKYIDETGEALVKLAFIKREPTTVHTDVADNQQPYTYYREAPYTPVDALISMLQKELDRKNEQLTTKDIQLAEKDRQLTRQQESIQELTAALEHSTESLKAAQLLHAGTMQKQLSDGAEPTYDVSTPVSAERKLRWFGRKNLKRNP